MNCVAIVFPVLLYTNTANIDTAHFTHNFTLTTPGGMKAHAQISSINQGKKGKDAIEQVKDKTNVHLSVGLSQY